MYKEFYKPGLNPFEITPDPSFLFLTKKHQGALIALYYGVHRRKGFVALTGGVGTGKTLLIRCLLRMLKNSDIACAYVFNSRLSTLEFLNYLATEFGLAASGKTEGEVLQDFRRCLVTRHQTNLTSMIVVDDAQDLSIEVLEEIRLLTNLATEEEKLLLILLVGQQELDEKLDFFKLRQLKQRIALRSHLEPSNLEETSGYIRHRPQLAGARSEVHDLFADETIERVYRHSRGVARLVNTVCENALIGDFARQLTRVPPDIIDEVAYDLRLSVASPPRAERRKSNDEVLQAHEDTTLIVQLAVTHMTGMDGAHFVSQARAVPREPTRLRSCKCFMSPAQSVSIPGAGGDLEDLTDKLRALADQQVGADRTINVDEPDDTVTREAKRVRHHMPRETSRMQRAAPWHRVTQPIKLTPRRQFSSTGPNLAPSPVVRAAFSVYCVYCCAGIEPRILGLGCNEN